jgi:hypothetical protein
MYSVSETSLRARHHQIVAHIVTSALECYIDDVLGSKEKLPCTCRYRVTSRGRHEETRSVFVSCDEVSPSAMVNLCTAAVSTH